MDQNERKKIISDYHAEIGRKGGKAKSARKARSSRINGLKGWAKKEIKK